jgi:hypothetical protein
MCLVVPDINCHAAPSVGVIGAGSISLPSMTCRRTTSFSTSVCEPYESKVRLNERTVGLSIDERRSSVALTEERKSMR